MFASAYYERHQRSLTRMSECEALAVKEKDEAVSALLSAGAARVLEAVEGAIGALDAYKAQQDRAFPCGAIPRMLSSLEEAFRDAMTTAQQRKGEALRASEGALVARMHARAAAVQAAEAKAAAEARAVMEAKAAADAKAASDAKAAMRAIRYKQLRAEDKKKATDRARLLASSSASVSARRALHVALEMIKKQQQQQRQQAGASSAAEMVEVAFGEPLPARARQVAAVPGAHPRCERAREGAGGGDDEGGGAAHARDMDEALSAGDVRRQGARGAQGAAAQARAR